MGKEIELAAPFGFDRSDPAGIDRNLTFFEGIDDEETVVVFDDMAIDDDTCEFVVLHSI